MKMKFGLYLLLSIFTLGVHAEQLPENSGTPAMDTTEQAIPAQETETTTQVSETTEMVGFSRGSVTRSAFTSAINEREPVDSLEKLPNSENQVTYFTELRDMSGQTAIHRWEHNGEVIAEVSFKVRGPRWRVWSSKSFSPDWTGDWKVSVINAAGETISEDVLAYVEQEVPATAPAANVETATEPTVPQ